jgi:hypothetical protein
VDEEAQLRIVENHIRALDAKLVGIDVRLHSLARRARSEADRLEHMELHGGETFLNSAEWSPTERQNCRSGVLDRERIIGQYARRDCLAESPIMAAVVAGALRSRACRCVADPGRKGRSLAEPPAQNCRSARGLRCAMLSA